jgi:hypothetical protein
MPAMRRVLVMLAIVGCDATPEERLASVCTIACRCEEAPLPGVQRQCVAACEREVMEEQLELPDACIDCIEANASSCRAVEQCLVACSPVDDIPQPSFPDAAVTP